jgi:excinuclease ABC subunit B
MRKAINETNRRRKKQVEYNEAYNITPQTIKKNILKSLSEENEFKERETKRLKKKIEDEIKGIGDIEVIIEFLEKKMFLAAKELRFENAAYLRDKIKDIKANYKIKA